MDLRWLSARIVFLEMTRGTRASNPPGTCVSRAIQRTGVRENAHGIVISDLVRGFQATSRTAQVFFIGDKFEYSNARRMPDYVVTCVL